MSPDSLVESPGKNTCSPSTPPPRGFTCKTNGCGQVKATRCPTGLPTGPKYLMLWGAWKLTALRGQFQKLAEDSSYPNHTSFWGQRASSDGSAQEPTGDDVLYLTEQHPVGFRASCEVSREYS